MSGLGICSHAASKAGVRPMLARSQVTVLASPAAACMERLGQASSSSRVNCRPLQLQRSRSTLGRGGACVVRAKPNARGGGDAKASKQQQKQKQQEEEEEDEEEVTLGAEDEGEDGFLDDDEYEDEFEDEEGDDYAQSFLEPDDVRRESTTGGTAWGELALKATHEVLQRPDMQGLELYLFRALPTTKKLDIRLDKLEDVYGSPSLDDIERFSRALNAVLEREMGVEAAGEVSFEVSSPGAERQVRVPEELERFQGLPLRVDYSAEDGSQASAVLVMESYDAEAGLSVWGLANVRANAKTKGRAISKKQLAQCFNIPVAKILLVRIHVDF